ncbi:MAG: helix-turn-helix domain-containing protein [Methylococcaceae bacterium]
MNLTPKPSQISTIKADLLAGKALNSVIAFELHKITRLAALIERLRGRGWLIDSTQDKGNGLASYTLTDGFKPEET